MKSAFIFPGQGSQNVGMAKELYENSPKARDILDLACALFCDFHEKKFNQTLLETMFQGPEDELKRTVYTQPAILSHSLALMAELESRTGFEKASLVAGHSLGEFTALAVAKVLEIEELIKLVLKRAELMESAPAGAMTAIIGMPEDKLNELIDSIDEASVANYNSPDQIVITGTKSGVKAAEEAISRESESLSIRTKVIPLQVGGAFHSPLMKEVSAKFAEEIEKLDFRTPEIPIIQNFTGKISTDPKLIKENLKKQMTGSVQWTKTVQELISGSNAIEKIQEIGPGRVLAGLVKKQNRNFPIESIDTINLIRT
jgi:[acyl-carrier-protein] S-malonyltransferase